MESSALYFNACTAGLTLLTFKQLSSAGWGGHKNDYVPANRQCDEYLRKILSCLFEIMKSFLPVLVIALGSRVKAEGERDLIYLMK